MALGRWPAVNSPALRTSITTAPLRKYSWASFFEILSAPLEQQERSQQHNRDNY